MHFVHQPEQSRLHYDYSASPMASHFPFPVINSRAETQSHVVQDADTEPKLSAFAQFMLEEEERFYATFPAARQAAIDEWHTRQGTDRHYFQGVGFQSYPDAGPHRSDTQLCMPATQTSHVPDALFLYTQGYTTSFSVINEVPWAAQQTGNRPGSTHVPTPERSFSSYELYQGHKDVCMAPEDHVIDRALTPEVIRPPLVVPSQLPPVIDNPGTSAIKTEPSQDFSQRSCSGSPVPVHSELASPIDADAQPYTGHWQVDAEAAERRRLHAPHPRYAPGTHPPPDAHVGSLDADSDEDIKPDHAEQHITPAQANGQLRRTAMKLLAKRGKSKTKAKTRTVKKPPPALACLFCRGRKIACGAPPADAEDRTCNQCERRNLQCRYPSESRRGVRKKATENVDP